jgi:hypothetical protein
LPDNWFEVFYDGCWHHVPAQTSVGCNVHCFVLNPVGRVSLQVNQYAVPLHDYFIRVVNSELVSLTPADLPIIPINGVVSFTPPRGEQYNLAIQIANEGIYRRLGPYPALTTTSPTNLPLTHIPALLAPSHGQNFTPGVPIPLSWSTFAGAGAANNNIYILWVKQNNGGWQGFNMGNSKSANLNGAGLGSWEWDIEVRNANHQPIGLSETGTFSVVWQSPSPSSMGDLFGGEEFLGEEFGGVVSPLETEASLISLIIRDMDGNIMSPIQGLEREMVDDFRARILGNSTMKFVQVEGFQPRERELIENIRALPNQDLDSDSQDDLLDWLFMTPEEQFLMYLEYLFGEFDNP